MERIETITNVTHSNVITVYIILRSAISRITKQTMDAIAKPLIPSLKKAFSATIQHHHHAATSTFFIPSGAVSLYSSTYFLHFSYTGYVLG